jgi:hypothetical protein
MLAQKALQDLQKGIRTQPRKRPKKRRLVSPWFLRVKMAHSSESLAKTMVSHTRGGVTPRRFFLVFFQAKVVSRFGGFADSNN